LRHHQGAFTTIDSPGSTATTATGINADGDIVGFYITSGVIHGFVAKGKASEGSEAGTAVATPACSTTRHAA